MLKKPDAYLLVSVTKKDFLVASYWPDERRIEAVRRVGGHANYPAVSRSRAVEAVEQTTERQRSRFVGSGQRVLSGDSDLRRKGRCDKVPERQNNLSKGSHLAEGSVDTAEQDDVRYDDSQHNIDPGTVSLDFGQKVPQNETVSELHEIRLSTRV